MRCRCTAGFGGSPVGSTERRSTIPRRCSRRRRHAIGSVTGFGLNARHPWYHPRRFRASEAICEPGFQPFTGFGAIRGPATACSSSDRERPDRVAVWPRLQVEFGAGSFEGSGVSSCWSAGRCQRRSAQSCTAWPSARNWSACSSRRLWLVSCAMASPSCWTLTVSPRAHRLHSSSGFDLSSQDRRPGRAVWRSRTRRVVAIERRVGLVDACSCLVVLVDVGRVRCRVRWRCSTARSTAHFGGGEFVASGPSPAEAAVSRRCCASVCCHRA